MDYETLLNIESESESVFYICFPAFIIGCLIVVFAIQFSNTAIVKKLDERGIMMVVVALSLVAIPVGGAGAFITWIQNDAKVEKALSIDATSQSMVVTEKHELPRYTNYKLRCGRFDNIAARIPKYADLSGRAAYAASFQDLSCWVNDETLVSKINEAINLYEIYNNK